MRAWVLVVWAGWATIAGASPVVIHDAGGTEPIAPFLEPLRPPPDEDPVPLSEIEAQGVFDLRNRLPITSPGLRPGLLSRDASDDVLERLRFLSRPVCLVGSDAGSLQWLERHGETLRAIGAACLAIDVPDEVAWEQLVAAGQGLPLIPVPGADLVETLGLTVYPVLITQDGFEQ